MRIGHGYDAHRFAEGRRLILGGVHIPYSRGLLAHSDGDVGWCTLCAMHCWRRGTGRYRRAFPRQRRRVQRRE